MKLKVVVINLEISKTAKRRALLVGIPAAMLLVGGVALATVPHTFANGEVLNASDLNGDLSALDTRVTAVETKRPVLTVKGVSYSLDAKYCGVTAPTTGAVTVGVLSGWPAVKSLCEATCSSPSAHLCTGNELVRSAQLGVTMTDGSYANGDSYIGSEGGGFDCMGFTSGASTAFTNSITNAWAHWFSEVNYHNFPAPQFDCSVSQPLLCCD